MSPKQYLYQFLFSPEKKLVNLLGAVQQTGSVGTAATLVDNGITYTAVRFGTEGNSITVALVAGGTAGAEVVTVSGNAISVSVESGVSTRTQVETAIEANAAAAALVSVSVASGATPATLMAATALATGTSTPFSNNGKYFDLVQINTGLYEIQIPANNGVAQYKDLLAIGITLQKAAATDVKSEMVSVNLATGKIVFRVIAVATATNLANGDVIYLDMKFRNSTKW